MPIIIIIAGPTDAIYHRSQNLAHDGFHVFINHDEWKDRSVFSISFWCTSWYFDQKLLALVLLPAVKISYVYYYLMRTYISPETVPCFLFNLYAIKSFWHVWQRETIFMFIKQSFSVAHMLIVFIFLLMKLEHHLT